ncbi:MAG: FxsA family protein [Humibacillus sp.]|nr:FxsA family protein [Humibacillus sp.]MDN5779012.1 FxsA family protein [Humibacillus sp.]
MTTTPGRRRLRPTKIAAMGLLLLAILEVVVLIAVGRAIGAWPTFLLILASSLLGLWIIRHEGSKAFRAFQSAAQSGRMPAREIADGTLVLAGGLLLTAPGFITDVIGLLLVLPFTRPVARNLLTAAITSRIVAQTDGFTTDPRVTGGPADAAFPGAGGPQGARRSESSDEVVEGEIIDDDPPSGAY